MGMHDAAAKELADLFRLSLKRLLQELQVFPSDEILWAKLPGISNSAGNLFLHLEGNLREYIGRQLGGIGYTRHRDLEFSSPPVPASALLQRIQTLPDLIPGVLAALSREDLEAKYPEDVMGVPLSTRQFLIHLIGHLNYHLGQIDYLRRVLTGDSVSEPNRKFLIPAK
jgi:uncharacterized damage-inducible protein DinB